MGHNYLKVVNGTLIFVSSYGKQSLVAPCFYKGLSFITNRINSCEEKYREIAKDFFLFV